MPTLKNRMFQPLGVLLSDHTMLHVAARGECRVAAAELDGPHLKAVLQSGQLALTPSATAAAGQKQAAPVPKARKGSNQMPKRPSRGAPPPSQ